VQHLQRGVALAVLDPGQVGRARLRPGQIGQIEAAADPQPLQPLTKGRPLGGALRLPSHPCHARSGWGWKASRRCMFGAICRGGERAVLAVESVANLRRVAAVGYAVVAFGIGQGGAIGGRTSARHDCPPPPKTDCDVSFLHAPLALVSSAGPGRFRPLSPPDGRLVAGEGGGRLGLLDPDVLLDHLLLHRWCGSARGRTTSALGWSSGSAFVGVGTNHRPLAPRGGMAAVVTADEVTEWSWGCAGVRSRAEGRARRRRMEV
jgi:hypothetical protein